MTAAKPLDTLIDLARSARDTAGQQLAGARKTELQLSEQIHQLELYRREYVLKLQETLKSGMSLATVNDYRRFIVSLDDAIAGARKELASRQVLVTERQQDLQREQRRLKSYDTLASRREQEVRRVEQRRELRLSDEINNNLYARQRLDAQKQDIGEGV